MYEVKYSITRRTDGKTVHRKKKLPLIMTELPDVLCLEIRNSYSFICKNEIDSKYGDSLNLHICCKNVI